MPFNRCSNTLYFYSVLRKIFLVSVLISLFFVAMFAQHRTKNFAIVPIEINGQETSSVKDIVQDHQGFIWLITADGLVRYDGYNFKLYKHNPEDSTSIKEEELELLYVDHKGKLWVGTLSGLSRYDLGCDCFIHYFFDPAQFKNNKIPFPKNGLSAITEDKDKGLWVSTSGGGLFKFDSTQDEFVRFLEKEISYDLIRVLLVDQQNNIWIGTGFGAPETGTGLIRFNTKTGEVKRFLHNPEDPTSLLDNRVSALMQDQDGKIWVGTYKSGLHYFDPSTTSFVRVYRDEDNQDKIHAPSGDYETWANDPFVRILHQDRNGGYWVGTIGKGVNHFDGQTGKLTFYDPAELEGDLFKNYWSFFEDRQGQIWLGGPVASLYKLDLFGRDFIRYPKLAAAQRSCESTIKNDVIWAGTLGEGLKRLDFNTGALTSFKHDEADKNSLANDVVRGVYADDQNNLWLGLGIEVEDVNNRQGIGGLNKLDIETGDFSYYPIKRHDSLKASETVFTIQEDQKGHLWLATGIGGLYRSNKAKTFFTPFTSFGSEQNDKQASIVYYVYEADDKIWACNEIDSTLYYFDYQKDQFIPFLKGYSTNFIEVDHKGDYWIGTWDNGLIHLDPADKSYTHFTKQDGLPSNGSVIPLEGEDGKIWISTKKGMTLFDTHTKQFSSNGLPHEYFHESGFKTRSGRLVFGGNTGLYSFYPGQGSGNPFSPELYLKSLQISGEPYNLNEVRTNSLTSINLNYHQNDLTFNYDGFHFGRPSKNKFKYKLEPFDKEWIDAGTQRTARYTNLDPGTYTFYFTAANSEGVWSKQPSSVLIHIAPLLWTTWWAFALYFLLFLTLIYLLYSFLLSRKMDKQEALRLKELNIFKSRFYANITHEFRTPLTVIEGLSDSLIHQPKEDGQKKLKLIKKNSKSLLNLVNQMLDLTKLQAGYLQVDYQQQDIISYLRYLVESHESYTRSKKISIQFYSEEQEFLMDVDEHKLERIMLNLISNAIKFTPEHGKILIVAKPIYYFGERQFQIQIQDTGVGVAEEILPYIFERYFSENNNPGQQGSGIGLALVKELVQALDGEIEVESVVGKGTCFLMRLPINRKAPLLKKSHRGVINTLEQKEHLTVNLDDLEKDSLIEDKPVLLLFEDNSDVAYYINNCLADDYQIAHKRNGKDGLQKAFDLIPDIIICDVMMPGMDGLQVCQKLKTDERTNHIPIILLTAKASAEDKLVGLEHGADAYLTKPFDKSELQTRLANLLEIRKTLQAKYSASINEDRRSNPDVRRDESSGGGSANDLHPFLKRIEIMVLENLSYENLSVENLSAWVHLSNSQVSRKIKALSGMSTNLFIRSIRLREAKKLLETTSDTISEISFQTGFSSPVYFSQMFKKAFEESPSAFQKRIRHAKEDKNK